MDLRSGEIKEVKPNETPKEGSIEISPFEQRYLDHVPKEMRPFELAWLRTYKREKWDGFKKATMKNAFRLGWNSAIFMKANFYVLTDKELSEGDKSEQNGKA